MDIKKEMDLTILFIAHNLAVVKYFSDRIGVMHFGTMVELADADELYAHPVHPYTKSLLSAIPQPDPDREKDKQRIYYDPSMHDYSKEQPSFQEIRPVTLYMLLILRWRSTERNYKRQEQTRWSAA